jgi:glycosyltransferase involved in cell wall biosynthesis/GT2 family glycosyltransferase/SAM-dependent methyltransferase
MNEDNISAVDQISLYPLLSKDLDPLFWTPERMGLSSAWWAHVPFAFWITAACKPRLLVELGTHNGVSYAAFCEAVLQVGLGTRCYAVDTWAGDEHAGYYGDQIYNDLRALHDKRYAAFSELIRSTFDDALRYFEDESIDLLHIDGFHTYEAVRNDFETWRQKLSRRAVVLFHDTNVRRDDFGVYKFFGELSQQFPSFEFLHGFGLGVVAVGAEAPTIVQQLCSLTDSREIGTLRERFSHLGARWFVAARESLSVADLQRQIGQLKERERSEDAQVAEVDRQLAEITKQLAEVARQRDTAEASVAEANVRCENIERRAERVRERAATRVMELHNAVEGRDSETQDLRLKLAAFRRQFASLPVAPGWRSHSHSSPSKRLVEFFNPELRRKRRTRRRLEAHLYGLADIIRHSPYFDEQWYRVTYPDVAGSGIDPAWHYVKHGAAEGRDPGPAFSTRQYLENNPDVATAGTNALYHYMRFGEAEGRSIRPKTPHPSAPRWRGVGSLDTPSLVYVSGEPDTPGNQYRVLRYIEAAHTNGMSATWIRLEDLPRRMDELSRHDVLIIWRAAWNEDIEAAVDLMRAQHKKIVFDVDDLMFIPELARVKFIDGIRSQFLTENIVRDHYTRVRQTMNAADLCFTTTEELAFHMRGAGKLAYVLPNGFDQITHDTSRRAAREWRLTKSDKLIRIGYAGGSRTHQRDLGLAIEAIAKLLREYPACRLVLFRTPEDKVPLIEIGEYSVLTGLEDRIEWRPMQPLQYLPFEMARFDINLAPLEFGSPFCEAKSELKFFEAALVDVPTIASPTGPFRRAIDHGKTGFLAATADDWYVYLKRLADSPELRRRVAREAYHASLAKFGTLQRVSQFGRVVEQLRGGAAAARAFALEARLTAQGYSAPKVFDTEVVFEQDRLGDARVTVIIPLYNYERYVVEALESVRVQTLDQLDLIIVDDYSTDNSLAVVKAWAEENADRFNRILVLRNCANYGLGFSRNSAFAAANTAYVLPLDADNKLLPDCCAALLRTIRRKCTAYVYPSIQHFGASSQIIGSLPYDPQRLVAGNYIDAMALISKEAWAMIGGYNHVRFGWEDYDFWCRLAEHGLHGEWQPEVLAQYRVHSSSMLTAQTTVPDNYRRLHENFTTRHPWVSLGEQHTSRRLPSPQPHLTAPAEASRIDVLVSVLRCPQTGQKLAFNDERSALLTLDGLRTWPVIEGRPILAAQLSNPEIRPADHISNDLPDAALDLINNTKGLVLNLSAGGSRQKFDHVVEVEFAIFGHTDVIADAHELPFDDEVFDAVIVMNAFEHYREPHRVAEELRRVLKPEGKILVRTAFMQPLHEQPMHFFNCTRYGLAEWFKNFTHDRLHVSENFSPNHSIAWLLSEAEAALRQDVSAASADAFLGAPISELVSLWRDPSKRSIPLWTDFDKLSQTTQEISAAGFEFWGHKPPRLSDLKS